VNAKTPPKQSLDGAPSTPDNQILHGPAPDLLSYELGGETNPHLDFVCGLFSLGDFPEYGSE
jgi:hypothetical protein